MNIKKIYPKEECGVVGLYNIKEAAAFAYLGIHALQHRGQESAGIVSSDGHHLLRFAGMGKVTDVFTENKLKQLKGSLAIAHNRYSTTGASFLRNAQPIRVDSRLGSMALAHNGNLTNAWQLRKRLEARGTIFQTTVDSEVISHLIALSPYENLKEAFIDALSTVKGAYSLVLLIKDELYAVRDPNGFRPLVIGKKGKGWLFASETCALDIMNADYVRDVLPGELIIINKYGFTSSFPFQRKPRETKCIFEYVYFSRPDSIIFGSSVYESRMKMGEILAEESPVEADIVISVPDSSNVAAIGFSRKSKIPLHMGLIRSHYIGRTFIEPDQKIRNFGAKIKYNVIRHAVKDKKIVVIDDSIIRGTTSKKLIKMLFAAGAREIHLRISSAPSRFPCYYGIDIPTQKELIASSNTVEQIRDYLDVTSLAYLSISGMKQASGSEDTFCTACFDGNHPISLETGQTEIYSNQKSLFEELKIEEH